MGQAGVMGWLVPSARARPVIRWGSWGGGVSGLARPLASDWVTMRRAVAGVNPAAVPALVSQGIVFQGSGNS